jgi:hypothetical protein
MTAPVHIGEATLWHGDCLQLLPGTATAHIQQACLNGWPKRKA